MHEYRCYEKAIELTMLKFLHFKLPKTHTQTAPSFEALNTAYRL